MTIFFTVLNPLSLSNTKTDFLKIGDFTFQTNSKVSINSIILHSHDFLY
jgi:hypothetical protein